MSKKIYRKCKCCGKEYEYCGNCGSSGRNEPWKNLCDTLACREILNVVSAYNLGMVSIDKVKDIMGKYDVKDTSQYLENIKAVLDMAKPKAERKNIFEEPEIEEPRPSRRRSWKSDVDSIEDGASE